MPIKLKDVHIEIDGVTYTLQVAEPDGRRLTLSLIRVVPEHCTLEELEVSGQMMNFRSQALKTIFAHTFPDAATFREISCMYSYCTEWKYVLPGAKQEHIDWAEHAKACKVIDSFLVDYGD